MDKYDSFIAAIDSAVERFRELDDSPVRIVSHLDSDGIASASILIKALKREDRKFSLSIVKQIDQDLLESLKREEYQILFFVDLGSGYLNNIGQYLQGKKVFILDHHKPEEIPTEVVHVNPHLFGIDGGSEISGAGVVYFFVKKLDERNMDLAHLAVIGAIGDIQEKKGFLKLNDKILADAVSMGKMVVKKGLSMFGMQTRPIHKVLEYNTSPYIPGVTGNETGAIRFLEEIGINIKENGQYKKLIHLDDEDMKKLVTAIILRRIGSEDKPEDVLGPIYILTEEDDEVPTKDAKEFSTLLNATGRLNKSSLGIGTCLGNKRIKDEAINLLARYKKEIIGSLDWFYKNRKSDRILERKGYVIINAEDNVRDTLIGTLASILAKSNIYQEGTIILGLAHTLEGDTKVSIRCAGLRENDVDLRQIIMNIAKKINAMGGGHKEAAGAIIPQDKETEFIKVAEEMLSKVVIEEKVK